MNEKIEFVKWLIKNLTWMHVLFFIQIIICASLWVFPEPFDMYAAYYLIISLVIGAIITFIVTPLRWAYQTFEREKNDNISR